MIRSGKIGFMATSHIGRLLRKRIEEERLKIAMGLLDGDVAEQRLTYWQGYAAGLQVAMNILDEIEREGE